MKKLLDLLFSEKTNSPLLETILIGTFALFFAVWLLFMLPSFGKDAPVLLLTCAGLGSWFLITEVIKTLPIFNNIKFRNFLLLADTVIFGSLILYMIYLFHLNESQDRSIEFLLLLPAVSVPLYYGFLPGLLSLVTIYASYIAIAIIDGASFGGGKILLKVLSYVLVYILVSITINKKTSANEKLTTALKKIESLDKAKDTFIATASHELKGPVTILAGYLSILKEDKLTAKELKDTINRANEGAQNLTTLTKRLFDINKIQLHKLELNPDTFSPEEISKKIIVDYEKTNKNSSLKFTFKESGIITPIYADKELLKEVVINLLNNAVKFTAEGEIVLSIQGKADEIVFSIKDTGTGMSKNDQDNIFKKFYQSDDSQTNRLGLGLGLYLCHEIVNAHKGKIWVESEIGKGSTFHFSVPKEPSLVK